MNVRKQILSLGQFLEFAQRPDASLYLTKSHGWDIEVIKFGSRAALEAFNKRANLSAIVKTVVPKGCAIYRHQKEAAD